MVGRGSVFIVEDDPQLLGALIAAFNQRGYFAWGCPWDEGARVFLGGVRTDFLLVEVEGGDYGRMELVESCKKLSPGTRVIVESALADAELKNRAMSCGVDAFLVKPFSLQPLFELLERAPTPKLLQ